MGRYIEDIAIGDTWRSQATTASPSRGELDSVIAT